MRNTIDWMGRWRVQTAQGEQVIFNNITDDGLTWLKAQCQGAKDGGFKYIAVGTSDTAESHSDHVLGAEAARKPIFEFASPDLFTLQSIVTFGDDEAVCLIREVGLFAGDAATEAADTGVLISRSVVLIDKTSPGTLRIVREDVHRRAAGE
jgi:hypothetical protein